MAAFNSFSYNLTTLCKPEDTTFLALNTSSEDWLYSTTDRIIANVVVPTSSAVGILGNVAFLFTIVTQRRMQNSLNVYLSNLAVADLAFLASTWYWYTAMFNGDEQISGDYAATDSNFDCAVYSMTTRLWYAASVMLLTIISVERFLAICAPFRHRLMIGKKRTVKLLLFAWLFALMFTASLTPGKMRLQASCLVWPPGEEYQNLPILYKHCEPINDVAEVIAEILILLIFLISFAVNVTLYARIIFALSRRLLDTQGKSDVINNIPHSDAVRNQVARTLIINGIVFFICQTPYRVISLDRMIEAIRGVPILQRHTHFTLKTISHAFLFFNSIVNPFLYVGSCRHYRHAMRDAFLLILPRYSKVKKQQCSLDDQNKP